MNTSNLIKEFDLSPYLLASKAFAEGGEGCLFEGKLKSSSSYLNNKKRKLEENKEGQEKEELIAVKIYKKDPYIEKGSFMQEATLQYELKHPLLLPILGIIQSKEAIVYPRLYGSLGDYIQEYKKISSFEQHLSMAKNMVESVVFLHSRNLIHKDLGLNNFLVDKKDKVNKVVLADLSTVSNVSSKENLQDIGNPTGCIEFCAPELFNNYHPNPVPASKASDIYALSISLWCLFSMKIPYNSTNLRTDSQIERHVLKGGRLPFSRSIPLVIREMISSGWNHIPEKRITAEEMKNILYSNFIFS